MLTKSTEGLSDEVFHDSGQVDGGATVDALRVTALAEFASDFPSELGGSTTCCRMELGYSRVTGIKVFWYKSLRYL